MDRTNPSTGPPGPRRIPDCTRGARTVAYLFERDLYRLIEVDVECETPVMESSIE